jgi:hypothetical protein
VNVIFTCEARSQSATGSAHGYLLDIAGSDTDLKHSEIEEVRAIVYGLKVSHREFIQAKLKYLETARSK